MHQKVDDDYYGILGLAKPRLGDATYSERDIRQAYRRKALELHPDKNADDPLAPTKFNRLTAAFEFLLVDEQRVQYNDRLWEAARKAESVQRQDVEKRRLAQALKEREAAARRKETSAEATRYLARTFPRKRPAATSTWSDQRPSSSFSMDMNQINREKERLFVAGKKPDVVAAELGAEASENYTFILKLKWTPEGAYTEERLRPLLRQHAPFRILLCDSCAALIQFFDQRKALAAAVSVAMPSDDCNNPSSTFTGVRVIKKPRSGLSNSNKAASVDIDDDEVVNCLTERHARTATESLDKDASDSSAAPSKKNSVLQRLFEKRSLRTESESSRPSGEKSSSNAGGRPSEVIDLSSELPSREPSVASSSEGVEHNFEKLENDTLSLLKAAIERKKART